MSDVARMRASPYSCERGPYEGRGGKRASRPDGSPSPPRSVPFRPAGTPGLNSGIHVFQAVG